MFNTLFRVWVELFEEEKLNFWWGKFYFLKKMCFWKLLESFMKLGFELCFCRKFQVLKKFWVSAFSIVQSCLSTDRKRAIFRSKLTISFDSCSIPFVQSKSVFKIFRLPLDSSRPIEFHVFQILKRNQISTFQNFVFFLSSPLDFSTLNFFFFFVFSESKLQRFSFT